MNEGGSANVDQGGGIGVHFKHLTDFAPSLETVTLSSSAYTGRFFGMGASAGKN
jgi:hypothetical protein